MLDVLGYKDLEQPQRHRWSITDKITSFLNRIYKIDEWIKNSEISEILFSHLSYLNQKIKENHKYPSLIIFDIDDTLLDTSKFSKNFPMFDGLDPTITFYQYVMDLGYHVVLLTARKEDRRNATIRNLDRLGIKGYDDLIFRKDEDLGISFGKYKLKERKNLSKNYTIIANIGDQISDFEGGYNGKIIKIPNF